MQNQYSLSPFVSRAALLVAVVVMAIGCQTTEDDKEKAARIAPKPKARLAVMYYPYDVDDERIASPLPRYAGLTTRRMRIDAAALAKSPFDIVVVRMSSATCRDKERVARCRELVRALANRGMPKIVLQLDAESLSAGELNGLLEALLDGGHLDVAPGYLRVGGEPVVLFHSGSGKAVEKDFVGLKLDYDTRNWHRIYAGSGAVVEGAVKWIDKRSERRLRDRLRHSDGAGAVVILVESWNDYRTGSFVEWNSLDQGSMLETIKEWKSE
jgi:hypothetical protein